MAGKVKPGSISRILLSILTWADIAQVSHMDVLLLYSPLRNGIRLYDTMFGKVKDMANDLYLRNVKCFYQQILY